MLLGEIEILLLGRGLDGTKGEIEGGCRGEGPSEGRE